MAQVPRTMMMRRPYQPDSVALGRGGAAVAAAPALSAAPLPSPAGSAGRAVPFAPVGGEPGLVGLRLTGYLDTEIRRRSPLVPAAQRYRWSLQPGTDRAQELRAMSADLRRALEPVIRATDVSHCTLSIGWPDGRRRHHLAPGSTSIATQLAATGPDVDEPGAVRAAADFGRALRALGNAGADAAAPLPGPASTSRLAAWLRTGDGPWSAAMMYDRLLAALGRARVREAIDWAESLPRHSLVHGRAGLGVLIAAEQPGAAAALLIGDEVACGPRDFDLCWTLGEMVLIERAAARPGSTVSDALPRRITACRDALLTAYGPAEDLVLAGQMTALRVLLEIHDSAAYLDHHLDDLVEWAPELIDTAR